MPESLISGHQNSVQEMHTFELMQSNQVRNISNFTGNYGERPTLRCVTEGTVTAGEKKRKKRERRNCVGNVYRSLSRRPIASGGQTS